MIITVTLTALFISLQHRCDVGITEYVSFVQLCHWNMGFVHYNIHQNVHL